jgi:ABC-type uncharacterized transport system substrate-binding protein
MTSTNPVGMGFVASLARPGGNVTGVSVLGPETSGKRLELLKEMTPHVAKLQCSGIRTTRPISFR